MITEQIASANNSMAEQIFILMLRKGISGGKELLQTAHSRDVREVKASCWILIGGRPASGMGSSSSSRFKVAMIFGSEFCDKEL